MSTSTVEYTTGKRGKSNVIADGFRYSLDKKRTTAAGVVNSYWRCVTPGCSGRLVLHDDTISNTPSHNHGEQRAEITVHKAKKLLKHRAATSDMTTKHIVASAVAGLDFECRAKLGCRTNCLEKMARSARHTANRHPNNPTSLETLSIPPSYLQSQTGDNLLLWDSGWSSNLRRSYLFGTNDNMNILGSCNDLIVDGTFKVAPDLFTQLLTVHGITDDHYRLPLAYGLLPGKRQEHYQNLLDELDSFGPFQPDTVLADFELGLRNAIEEVWPSSTVRGCCFHFKQALWRNFHLFDLTPDIRKSFQRIGAFHFLPLEDIPDAWDELKLEQGLTDQKIADRLMLKPPPPRAQKWVNLDTKLENFVVAYDNDQYDNVVDFLSAVSATVF